MYNKIIISTVLLGWLLVSGCTKHEEFSLPPKLGEKGNGVTIQGVVINWNTGKPTMASIKLWNEHTPFLSIPKTTLISETMTDSNGQFRIENVVIVGNMEEVVTYVIASTDDPLPKLNFMYLDFNDKRYDTYAHLSILFKEVHEVYDLIIYIR